LTTPARWFLVAGALALCVTQARPSFAEPSLWARAANPQRAREADAKKRADKAISRDYSLSRKGLSFRRGLLLRRALSDLEQVGADESLDPDVRFRVAQVSYRLFDVDTDIQHIRTATEHFEFVVSARNVPASQRARALMSLAICYARLTRHHDEVEAYNRAIALQPDPLSHAVLLANQAEGLMARGRITAAVRGYRASLRATPTVMMLDSGVTTLWGLAVALDRSGDLDSALEKIRTARKYDPGDMRINGSHWFYVPAYDEHWYEALGHWQIARDAEDADVKRVAYDSAMASWQLFLNKAKTEDPWLRIADFRINQCQKERKKALDRLAKQGSKSAGKAGDGAPPETPDPSGHQWTP
jgi:tetratricopeptide (TPR) repeat protein